MPYGPEFIPSEDGDSPRSAVPAQLGDALQLSRAIEHHAALDRGPVYARFPNEYPVRLEVVHTPDGPVFDKGQEIARVETHTVTTAGATHQTTHHVFQESGDETTTSVWVSRPKDYDNLTFVERLAQDAQAFEGEDPGLFDPEGRISTADRDMSVPDIAQIYALKRAIETQGQL